MKQRINLSLEKELCKLLKRKQINISKYVDKLITNDLLSRASVGLQLSLS
ncbi:type II toxin-antitoxin system CcdA family antitoxin [Candidatus Woesearchaeota archaeon]|nr:type II toxin-antitoxin system CcdA family antitoxin [Candidatus Woesearchaeota archaeon]